MDSLLPAFHEFLDQVKIGFHHHGISVRAIGEEIFDQPLYGARVELAGNGLRVPREQNDDRVDDERIQTVG